jgi:predicted AlkP superfamily pyrophosphatase or phosphodiesterase
MDEGLGWADTHHGHADTETIAGHGTLATGAGPAAPGVIGNVWLDRHPGTLAYGIKDTGYHILNLRPSLFMKAPHVRTATSHP